MNDSFEKKLQMLSQHTFDEKLNTLDSDVLTRLKESRQKALASITATPVKKDKTEIFFPAWLPAASTATAFASAAVIATSLWMQPELSQQSIESPLNDIALLSASDDLEFYENIDFYIWLDDENAS